MSKDGRRRVPVRNKEGGPRCRRLLSRVRFALIFSSQRRSERATSTNANHQRTLLTSKPYSCEVNSRREVAPYAAAKSSLFTSSARLWTLSLL